MNNVEFDTIVFQEGKVFVAYSPKTFPSWKTMVSNSTLFIADSPSFVYLLEENIS